MDIHVLTLFPRMFEGVLSESILRIAREKGLLTVRLHDLRAYTANKHGKVDDEPYGGGPGMVLCCQPVFDAVAALEREFGACRRVLLSPQGAPFTQAAARRLAGEPRLLLLCGHYEGYDERIRLGLAWEEVSLGDFVLTGGEIPALAVIDAVARLVPGVLGDGASLEEESFAAGLLDFPQYTRPACFRGMEVPAVLRSGHHADIARWRRREAARRTRARRPDLWRARAQDDDPTAPHAPAPPHEDSP